MIEREPYPISSFCDVVRESAYELIENIQAPDALIGTTAISILSASIQGCADVRLPSGETKPLSINTSVIANSGERKTAAESKLSAALIERDDASIARHEADMMQYAAELDFWKEEGAGLKAQIRKLALKGEPIAHLKEYLKKHIAEKPRKPRLRRLLRLNATTRAVMDALDGEGESIAFISDEGHALLKGGAFQQIGLLNKAWDGARNLTLDRANGEKVIARNSRVTISLMVQESVFVDFLKRHGDEMRGSGHWARYLVAWPESTQGTRFIRKLRQEWNWLPMFTNRIRTILEEYDAMMRTGNVQRALLEFAPEVDDRWIYLSNAIEEMIQPNDDYHEIKDASSKAMEMVGRLAALFHYFSGDKGKIPLKTVNCAVDIVRWHLNEYKRVFSGEYRMRNAQQLGEKLAAHLQRRYADYGQMVIERNEILRNRVMRDADDLDDALEYLASQGRLREAIYSRHNQNGPTGTSRFNSGRKYGTRYVELENNAFPCGRSSLLGPD